MLVVPNLIRKMLIFLAEAAQGEGEEDFVVMLIAGVPLRHLIVYDEDSHFVPVFFLFFILFLFLCRCLCLLFKKPIVAGVFVSNLDFETSEEGLRNHFAQCGEVSIVDDMRHAPFSVSHFTLPLRVPPSRSCSSRSAFIFLAQTDQSVCRIPATRPTTFRLLLLPLIFFLRLLCRSLLVSCDLWSSRSIHL